MFSTKDMPSPSTMFSAYASMAASMMLFRSIANELVRLVPFPIRHYVADKLHRLFKFQAPMLTLVIEESNGMTHNRLYDAAETYLCSKISLKTGIRRLKLSKSLKEKHLTILLDEGETLVDSYDGIEFHWKFACTEQEKKNSSDPYNPPRTEKRFYELSFHSKHQDIVLASYVPFLLEKAEAFRDQQRVLKMYTLNKSIYSAGVNWESINLEHPATFDTLAMDPDLKSSVIEDLNRFLRRKEFYKKVGRAWKRGYLLYGPPGTGKSSLVAAMANYLKFDIYDLQLANIFSDSELRKLLLATANRSILVIEDIDCSVDFPDRLGVGDGLKKSDSRRTSLTLAGLLNFIDGLWSSCGDERIIIFTTNHKDRIDPSLLRPGRMDMHIHMSYCTYHGFKLLASNYLGIDGHHKLFPAVESLMVETQVTPAQVAEEMMKSEDVDVALEGLIKLLKYKKMEKDESDEVKAENNGGIRAALKQRTVDQ